MRIFQNLDTNEFQTDRSFGQALTSIPGRLYTNLRMEIGFCRPGTANTINLGTSPAIAWVLKKSTGTNKYDEQQLNAAVTFTQFTETNANGGTDYFYAGNLDLASPVFEKLLGVDHRTSLETFTVQCAADIAGNKVGKYFKIYTDAATTTLGIQLKYSGSTGLPSTGATSTTQVTIAANDTATTIAAAIATALSANADYTVTALAGVLTFTAKAYGAKGTHSQGTSGFPITLTTCGMSALTVDDVASVDLLSEISYEHSSQTQIGSMFTLTLQNCLRRPGASSPASTASSAVTTVTAISSGTNLVTVTFASAMADTSYMVDIAIENTTDATPQILFPGTIHSKTTAGFAFRMLGDTDSANYVCRSTAYTA